MIQEGGRVSFRLSLQTRRHQYFSRQQTTDTGARHSATGETIRQDSAGLHQVPVPAAGRARVPGAGGRGQVHQQIFFIKHKIFFYRTSNIFDILHMTCRSDRGEEPRPSPRKVIFNPREDVWDFSSDIELPWLAASSTGATQPAGGPLSPHHQATGAAPGRALEFKL